MVDIPCLDSCEQAPLKQGGVNICVKEYPDGMGFQRILRAKYLDSNRWSGGTWSRRSV